MGQLCQVMEWCMESRAVIRKIIIRIHVSASGEQGNAYRSLRFSSSLRFEQLATCGFINWNIAAFRTILLHCLLLLQSLRTQL